MPGKSESAAIFGFCIFLLVNFKSPITSSNRENSLLQAKDKKQMLGKSSLRSKAIQEILTLTFRYEFHYFEFGSFMHLNVASSNFDDLDFRVCKDIYLLAARQNSYLNFLLEEN